MHESSEATSAPNRRKYPLFSALTLGTVSQKADKAIKQKLDAVRRETEELTAALTDPKKSAEIAAAYRAELEKTAA